MAEDQYRFRTTDGVDHPVRKWSGPELVPRRGTILCLHGIQSHSGWYRWSSDGLAESGWGVHFPDRRGSGRSNERRGDARSAERLIDDVVELAREIREIDLPCVLLGLSWGARLAAVVAARHPDLFSRLVLLYPGIHTHVRPTAFQRRAMRLALLFGQGLRTVPIPLRDPALFTTDPQWQEFIHKDFLALHQLTLRFLAASESLAEEAEDAAEAISLPTLMLLAENDRIVDNAAARAWFHRLPVVRKELAVIAGAAHTLEFEPSREEFLSRLQSWLNSPLKAE